MLIFGAAAGARQVVLRICAEYLQLLMRIRPANNPNHKSLPQVGIYYHFTV
jgi:hypothetical protein